MSPRNSVYDFTKGFLVVTMVAYHSLNYYLSGYHLAYAYVGYVTQSFVFYSGFMCGTVYFQRFVDNKANVYRRLTVRGLKLILLFLLVNLAINALLQRNYNDQALGLHAFFKNIFFVFITGGQYADFPILLPIGYVLIVSAPLINLCKAKYILYSLLLAAFLFLSFHDLQPFFNLSCVLFGVVGVFTGLIYNEKQDLLNHFFVKLATIASLFFFLFILIPLGIDPRKYFGLCLLYVNVIILGLHFLGSLLSPPRWLTKVVIKFGQYSLFLYFAQIFFLQILKREFFSFRLPSLSIVHFLIFISVNILMIGSYYLVDYLRSKYAFANKFYRFVFA